MDLEIMKHPETQLRIFETGGLDFTLMEHPAVLTIGDALAPVPPMPAKPGRGVCG